MIHPEMALQIPILDIAAPTCCITISGMSGINGVHKEQWFLVLVPFKNKAAFSHKQNRCKQNYVPLDTFPSFYPPLI